MQARYNRFDICEAHYLFARHYHVGGDTDRDDYARLNRIKFKPGLSLVANDDPGEALSTNGAAIYRDLVRREKGAWAGCDCEFCRVADVLQQAAEAAMAAERAQSIDGDSQDAAKYAQVQAEIDALVRELCEHCGAES